MSSRNSMGLVFFMLLFIVAVSSVHAQDFDQVQIKTVKVANGVYMLMGSGGNIGVLRGADGVFMIDDQYAPLTDTSFSVRHFVCRSDTMLSS